ncbi:MAG: HEAT repeat domain-containing protein [Verrucomicrobiota bacterium]
MTAQTIFTLGLVGLAFIFLVLLISRKDNPTAPEEVVPQKLSSAPLLNSRSTQLPAISNQKPGSNNSPAPTPTIKAGSVEERMAELEGLGTRNGPESFQRIVAALSDSNPEIRQAAREAILQFGNRDAIPILKDLASKTEDAREKVALLDTVEFLSLPSLSEVRQQQRTNSRSSAVTNSPVAPK